MNHQDNKSEKAQQTPVGTGAAPSRAPVPEVPAPASAREDLSALEPGDTPTSQKNIKTFVWFLAKEVLGKTVLLCLLATFATHLLLMLNPKASAEERMTRLTRIADASSARNAGEKLLRRYLAGDVHARWMNSDGAEIDHRRRTVMSTLMTQDMAAALQRDPSIARKESRIGQQEFLFYFAWLRDLVTGNFGYIEQGLALKSELLARLPVTFGLAIVSLLLTVALALYGAFFYYLKERLAFAKAQDLSFYAISSLPAFIIGYLFLRLFGVGGIGSQNLLFPIVTLTISNGILAEILVAMKSSLHNVAEHNYVAFARSKGLSNWQVLTRHIFRNALIEILPKVSQKMAFIVSGTIVVEKVFSINGLADMLIDGLGNHDHARVLIVILVATILVRIGTVLADTMLYLLNPKYGAGR